MAIRGIFRLACGNLVVAALWASVGFPGVAAAQYQPSPVYVDDSPSAEEAIARARTLAASGVPDEAARVLQRALDEHGDRVISVSGDADLFIPVRRAVHAALAADTRLLERYIALHETRAAALLRLGDIEAVERSYLMTPSGFEATLRVVQRFFEHAAFEAAALALEQIESHPSLDARSAASAVALAEQVSAYVPESSPNAPMVRRIVRSWRAIAGLPEAPPPGPAEAPPVIRSLSPYSPLEAPALAGVLSKPMASARLGETPEAIRQIAGENSNRMLPEQARVLNAVPVLAGDVVLTNDSETLTAFDRFTLAQRWRTTLVGPPALGQTLRYAALEDPSMVVVADPYAVALMGVSRAGRSARERVLAAVDVRTGELAWRTTLSESALPELQGSVLRGPVIVAENIVSASVARVAAGQKLLSVSMIGFDLATGKLVWNRPIGAIGYVSWGGSPDVTDAPTAVGGVVYRGDRIGLVAAVEQATGRTRWIRRMARSFEAALGDVDPWEGNSVVAIGERIVTLSPDRLRVAQLDARTGALLGTTSALDLGSPLYLVRVGDALAGVSGFRVVAIPLASVGVPGVRAQELATFEPGGIRGRVMAAGDALVVPTPRGVSVLRVAVTPEAAVTAERTDLPLDATGNAMIAEGQVVVVDDDRVHSYLSWETASALLSERIAATTDPGPAVTYAELAYRAAQDAVLVNSVDDAVERIESDPLAETSVAARERLFEAVMDMVEPQTPRQIGGPLADTHRNALVDRLMSIASTPTERVSALLATGRMLEAQNAASRAVERYQEILASPVLSEAPYSGGSTRIPAEIEAVRRLRRLVGVEGRTVYAAYDAELERLLVEQALETDPEVFAGLAHRYPVARRASTAWLEAARRWRAAGELREAIRALDEGMVAARESGLTADPVFGEIAGTLVRTLMDAGRYVPAARALDDVRAAGTHAPLTLGGAPLDEQAIGAQISRELAARSRRARVGAEFGAMALMDGYFIATPTGRGAAQMPADVVLLESMEGVRSLWTADPTTGLRHLWDTHAVGDVVRIDHEAVYFSDLRSPRLADRNVTRVSLRTGETEWVSPTFTSMFSERDPFLNTAGGPQRVDTPLQRMAPLTDIFALFETDTLALVERTGRIAAVDLVSGEPLWSTELSRARVNTVHDAASGDGLLVICGSRLLPPIPGGGLARSVADVVVVLDARTGEPTFEYEETTPMRWVRMTDDGRVIVAFDGGMACLDAVHRTVVWRNDLPLAQETMEGWPVAGGVVFRDFDNALYLVDGRDGTIGDAPLPVTDRLEPGAALVNVTQVPGGNIVVGTDRGVALLDRAGALIGLDAADFGQRILLPEIGSGAIVAIGVDGNPVEEGLSAYRLNMFDTISARTLRPTTGVHLGAMPRTLQLIDHRILINAGTVVAVIDAPAGADNTLPPDVPPMRLPTPEGVPPVPVPIPREPPPSEAPEVPAPVEAPVPSPQ